MKRSFTSVCAWTIIMVLLTTACKKQTDKYPSDPVSAYMNLAVGKYVRYRLDSTVYIFFGQRDTIISYQAKDVVDAQVTDAAGRPSWRVVRYLRDTASTNEADWKAATTYLVTPTYQQIEVSEDYLRFVKLKIPIIEGYSWLGNSYLPSFPYQPQFNFSNDGNIQNWDYTYQDVGASLTLNGKTYDSTISVLQEDESYNVPIPSPDVSASKNYWIEKYAKGIGLVYKEVVMWEYQPSSGPNPGYFNGFGLKMTILDHN